ncbi:hypothetical protein [Colwellia piezophila]|uniref:hypothetical protein n=1 Tax=Colwellia piezophila TaxID=211668 RepID=UPI00035D9EA0|nr:hypothetical protein [Colwellia piezophila]
MKIVLLALLSTLLIINPSFTIAQNFSCNYGQKAACLDYSDKVVDSDSICYDKYVCGFGGGGLICKKKYDELLRKNSSLVDDYNELLRKNSSLVDDYNELLRKHKNLINSYNDIEVENTNLSRKNEEVSSCLIYATSLQEAKNCSY